MRGVTCVHRKRIGVAQTKRYLVRLKHATAEGLQLRTIGTWHQA